MVSAQPWRSPRPLTPSPEGWGQVPALDARERGACSAGILPPPPRGGGQGAGHALRRPKLVGAAFATLMLAWAGSAPQTEAAPRQVTIHLAGKADQSLPVDFGPVVPAVRMAVGAKQSVAFRCANLSNRTLRFSAFEQIQPHGAVPAFKAHAGFVSQWVTLKPGATVTLPVEFKADPSLSSHVPEVYVTYTLRPVTGRP